MGSLSIVKYKTNEVPEWYACDSCKTHITKETDSFWSDHTTTTHHMYCRSVDNVVELNDEQNPRTEEKRIVVNVECISCSEVLGKLIVGFPPTVPPRDQNWRGVTILDLTKLVKWDGHAYHDATWE